MRRPFDPELLAILKTEIEFEHRVRCDPTAKADYEKRLMSHSGQQGVYELLTDPVTVTRNLRYVPCPAHRNYYVELHYVVSGMERITVAGREICLYPGDIFIPNQYTVFSMRELQEDDIVLSFIIQPRFFEDMCMRLQTNTLLRDFMIDALRREVSWNRYLHFRDPDDLVILNLIEAMAYAAFPYLNGENIQTGSDSAPEVTYQLMAALFNALARSMGSLEETSSTNFMEVIRQTTSNYLGKQYKTASLRELAEILNQSETTLSRQIKLVFGVTFKELLLQKRFDRALQLLSQTNLPITDVAIAVGYENTSFFYRRFKELYHISPREYRQQRNANSDAF